MTVWIDYVLVQRGWRVCIMDVHDHQVLVATAGFYWELVSLICGNFPGGVVDVDCIDDNIDGPGTCLGECCHFCWFRRGVLGASGVLLDQFLVAFGGGGRLWEVLLD